MNDSMIIPVKDPDFELYDQAMTRDDYLFFLSQPEAFKTLWNDQGPLQRLAFVAYFYDFAYIFGIIKEYPLKTHSAMNYFSEAKIDLEQKYARVARAEEAKRFIDDIAYYAQLFSMDESGKDQGTVEEMAKYRKQKIKKEFGDIREADKRQRMTIKLQLYLRFAGTVCRGLKRVIEQRPRYARFRQGGGEGIYEERERGFPNLALQNLKRTIEEKFDAELESPVGPPGAFSFEDVETLATFSLRADESNNFKISLEGPNAQVKFDIVAKEAKYGEEDILDAPHSIEEAMKHFMAVDKAAEQMRKCVPGVVVPEFSGRTKRVARKTKEGCKLHHCSYCQSIEPAPLTFLKCAKCKGKGTRFYCSVFCQVKHWLHRHYLEHL